jgi:hypothetical protein
VTAAALLAELNAAGIRVTRQDDQLRVRANPGVSITPFRESITGHKPALLAELRLREQIVSAAPVAEASFDRAAYDELWRRWAELQERASA